MKYFSQGIGMNGSVVGVPWVLLAGGLLAVAAGAGWALHSTTQSNTTQSSTTQSNTTQSNRIAIADYHLPDVSSSRDESGQQSIQQEGKFSVTIRKPAGHPRVDLGDAAGKPVTVACSTCHATRPPNFATSESADLDEFHQNLAYAHGKVSCLSCHNSRNYDTLHLADGSSVEYSEVMTLCAQCHGPKTRDYQHGAHGGMTGYWDLSRGPRTKNNCVDCHAPHTPQFPAMKPTFKPRDRFLSDDQGNHKGRPGGSNHE